MKFLTFEVPNISHSKVTAWTDRQTDRQTHRQTDLTGIITYPQTRMVIILLVDARGGCLSVLLLGGLSLHLNHLIAERVSAPYWQFGTLPIGIFLSNLDSRQLETCLMTSYCHFWNLSTFGDSRANWVFWPKLGVFRKSKFSRWRSDGVSMQLGGVLGSQITRLYDGTIFGWVQHT